MAEIINLATFALDTQKLQSNLNDLQDTYFDLRKEQKEYADQSKETAKQIESLTKAQKTLTSSAGDNSEAIAKNEKELQDLIKTQKDLYKSEQNLGIQMGTVRKEINQTTTQLRSYQDAEGKTASLIDLGNTALSRQIKNKNDARAANIALNNVANQLNPNIEEEAVLLKQLNSQMDKNTAFIKENSSETAKQKMNVGNYSSALEGLDGILQKFGINGQEVRTIVQGFTSTISTAGNDIANYSNKLIQSTASTLGFKTASQLAAESTTIQTLATEEQVTANVVLATTTNTATTATASSTIGLKAFSIALASTGIGLILVALGSLIAYFTNTQSGADKLNVVLETTKAVFNGILSVASGLGEKLVSAFQNPKKALSELYEFVKGNLINRFTAFRVILDGIVNLDFKKVTNGVLQAGTGVENLTDKIANGAKQVGKFLDDNAVKGVKVAAITRQIAQEQLKYNANQVAVNDALDEQLLISKDTSKSFAERGKAAENIIAITEKNGRAERNILELELKRLKIQQSIKGEKNLTNEERQAEIDLIAKIDDAEDRGLNARLEQSRVLSGLKKEQAEQAKKIQKEALDNALKQSKAEIDLFIAQQGFKRKSSEEEYKFNNELLSKEEKDLKLQLNAKKISQTEYEAQLLQLKNDALSKNADLVIENANLEIDAQTMKNQKILENDKYLSSEQLRIKQEALTAQLAAETKYQETLLEQGKINQVEYDLAIATVKAESKAKADELIEINKASEQEKTLLDLENQKTILADNFIALAEIEKQQNKIKLEQELKQAEDTGANTKIIKDKYAQYDKDIEQAKQANKVKLASDAFGSLAAIFGAESKAGKAAAVAQTTIDTYQSAVSAFKALSGIPIVGPILGGIAAGAAIATGFKAVKNITSTKTPEIKRPSYASGVIGLRGSGSGTSDNVTSNLSVGESVINARSTSMFANELSAINQAGGGVGLNGASNILNQNEMTNSANNSKMASMIAEAVAIGAEAGTKSGSQSGIKELSNDRKVMQDAKF